MFIVSTKRWSRAFASRADLFAWAAARAATNGIKPLGEVRVDHGDQPAPRVTLRLCDTLGLGHVAMKGGVR